PHSRTGQCSTPLRNCEISPNTEEIGGTPRRSKHLPDLGLVLDTVPVYAAYGSNMDPKQMAQRAPHSPIRGSGWLQGWRLTFGGSDLGWEGALASIVEDPDDHVFVVLYDVPEWDENSLDQWEGAARGLYHKVKLRVQVMEGEVVA